jgi:hypothetical protein
MHYTIDPKRQRFEPMTMHDTTNDPQKSKIRTHKPTMHYHALSCTTIDPSQIHLALAHWK